MRGPKTAFREAYIHLNSIKSMIDENILGLDSSCDIRDGNIVDGVRVYANVLKAGECLEEYAVFAA